MVSIFGWLHLSWSLSVLSTGRGNFYYLNYIPLLNFPGGTEGWDGEGRGRRLQDGGHMYTWLIHVNVWQKPPQYCKVIQFSSVAQSCPTLCDPMNRSTPGLPVHHQLPESTQTHVHWVGDAIQPSHPLLSPSPSTLNLSQHQSLFKWVSSSHQVAKILEVQVQHQSLQWTPRTDLV